MVTGAGSLDGTFGGILEKVVGTSLLLPVAIGRHILWVGLGFGGTPG